MEFPKSMKEVSEAVRLNIDNLEKEVMVLKKSLETAKQQMEKVDEDVKEQMTEFLDVNLFSFSEVIFFFLPLIGLFCLY